MSSTTIRARVSMFIDAPPARIYQAFVEPDWLTRFWLCSASGPLRVGESVAWHFMVAGAKANPKAILLETDQRIAWRWSDGLVQIDLDAFEGGTAVTLIHSEFPGTEPEQREAALNSTEGFSIVLCDLKTLLETGKSAGLTAAKARLIQARAGN